MKKLMVFLGAAMMLACTTLVGHAQLILSNAPRTISYQGYVLDATQKPISGNHRITIKLYDAAIEGTVLHTESFSASLQGGVFSVLLGSNEPLESSLHFDKPYWLGINVDDGAELVPRTALSSVPYAIHADAASSLVKDATGAVTSINGKAGDVVLKGGDGTLVQTDGKTITISVTPTGTEGKISAQGNGNVSSVTGTTNQITANPTTGNVVLTLPQDIHIAATPTFGGMTLSSLGTGIAHSSASGVLSSSLIVNNDVSATAAIADTKLATISTAGKVSNSATSASSTNTANTIVLRDGSGNFSAGTITGNLTGNASGTSANVTGTVAENHGGTNQATYSTGDILYASAANTLAKLPVGVAGDILTVSSGKPAWSAPAVTVTSAQGTADQVLVNGDLLSHNGAVIISTVQDISSTSSPSFAGITLSGKASAASTLSTDPTNCMTTKDYVDNLTATAWSINGNSGTTSGNYLGTADATDLSLSTNGAERVRITADGSLLLSGTSGSVPAAGMGTRMMWIPSLAAFRAGTADGSEWNNGSIGAQSIATGYGTLASGAQSVAMGFFTAAYGTASVAMGSGTASYVDGATAFGSACQAVGFNSVAMGDNTTSWGDGSLALGSNTNSFGLYSTAMGYNTSTTQNYGTSMGKNLTVGLSSFGFNGSTTNTTVDVSGMNNVAYFGDVDMIIGNDDNSPRSLKFYAGNSAANLSGGHFTSFKAQTQSADITYKLPSAQGAANSLMVNNGSGTLSWATLGSLSIPTGSGAANSVALWNSTSALGASNLYYVSGKVGIGVSSPTQALDISGNANISGTVTSGSGITTNGITMSGGKALLSYGTVTAGSAITIPNGVVVKITDDGVSAANTVTMPSGTNGQIMYIYNNDAQTTAGDVTIATNTMGVFVYIDGWQRAN